MTRSTPLKIVLCLLLLATTLVGFQTASAQEPVGLVCFTMNSTWTNLTDVNTVTFNIYSEALPPFSDPYFSQTFTVAPGNEFTIDITEAVPGFDFSGTVGVRWGFSTTSLTAVQIVGFVSNSNSILPNAECGIPEASAAAAPVFNDDRVNTDPAQSASATCLNSGGINVFYGNNQSFFVPQSLIDQVAATATDSNKFVASSDGTQNPSAYRLYVLQGGSVLQLNGPFHDTGLEYVIEFDCAGNAISYTYQP